MSKGNSMSRSASAALGIAGGLIAGVIFKQTWRLIARDDDTPDAGDLERSWAEVLIAATLQGAISGAVKAALNRGYLLHSQNDDDAE
ncbi:DUF4235 domain-containing protein [Actinoallomurus iriomotensis]|uniref:Membrane protein n=1 Tax=Actinoallomurus iriomotensis TaxID=478107 RepID=A0A9W6VU71_9ACTN|nr:DUF4235 domain-containing protein [Actinoallomurus iriomotensis]GLY80465.1 membrane protein [Actinoallomurus iriomotensis]GLY86643.1 membrane protein [Actinoallomurus iriomotensis]